MSRADARTAAAASTGEPSPAMSNHIRFDGAHQLHREPPPLPPRTSEAEDAARACLPAGESLRELDNHARQLSEMLQQRLSQLDERRAQVDLQHQQASQALAAAHQELLHRESEITTRLDALATERDRLFEEQREFSRWATRTTRELEGERKSLAAQTRHIQQSHASERSLLENRAAEIAARRATVERRIDELRSAHRDLLQQQLEQTPSMSRGGERMVAESRAEVQRARLNDEFRLALAELAQRRAELKSVAAQLEDQAARLSHQRQEAHDWSMARQQQLTRWAEELHEREQQLRCRESQIHERDDTQPIFQEVLDEPRTKQQSA